MESARNIDIVLFDKTGTMTKGEMGVTEVISFGKTTQEQVIQISSMLEEKSEHNIGKAIVKAVSGSPREWQSGLSRGGGKTAVKNFKIIKGLGVQGETDGKQYYIGGPKLVESLRLKVTNVDEVNRLSKQGKTIVYLIESKRLLGSGDRLSRGGEGVKVIGAIAIADQIRPESKEAIKALHNFGVKTAMVTGDSQDVADAVAKEIGIDIVYAQVLPEEKVNKVEELQQKGQKVAMVGDGVNDAPSLTQADIGIAIGAGTDVAIESAGIILVTNDPRNVVKIFTLSKATYRKMVQNLWWAAGYNIVAIPLATGFFGITLNPAAAAILMSMSTVIVAGNAQLLKKLDLSK